MDAMRAQSLAIETKGRREHQLLNIESALRRISAGYLADCLSCGEVIDIRRLNIDPTYTQCVECSDK
ncbi:MAG: DnaK suppressor protein [Pseudohongiellaceae bacterium]|jgi:DnaK suppressor protein